MRSAIRKKLVTQFSQELGLKLPQFQRASMPRGTPPIWRWQVSSTLTFFVLLQPFEKYDQFAVELAWSEDGEFPWGSFGRSDSSKPQGRVRVPHGESNQERLWDLAPEATAAVDARVDVYSRGEYVPYAAYDKAEPSVDQVLSRVNSAVDDAIRIFVQKGLPHLQSVATNQGLALPEVLPLERIQPRV